MRKFIHEAFLLESKVAEELYHEYAESLPIIDYHCHLSPEAIAIDKKFDSITDLWLAGDHYKWRALRTLGVAEHYITGDASDFEKFEKFAEHTPLMIRNPLYHWSHLELARYFNEYELLSGSNAKRIYEETTSLIKTPEFSTRSLLTQMKVEIVCTTEDPTDDLPFHDHMLAHPFSIYVSTAFRPDKAI
ncbi:MAG: glucuronate isomerase, partial [Flavobacteriaceae bacterium]